MENGRLDWLHAELAELRQDQQDGFAQVRSELQAMRADLNRRMDNHGDRIRALETWRAWVLGAAAAATAIATWVWQLTRG